MSKIRFTKRALEALPRCTGGRIYYHDEVQDNLALCVTATGSKVFYRVGRIDRRPVRVRLGAFPDLSIEQARQAVRRMNGAVANGEDPQAERRARRAEPTLGDLWTLWQDRMKAKRPRSQEEDASQYNLFLSKWKTKLLSSITRGDVAGLHARVGAEHPYRANRLVALLSSMWNEGARAGLTTIANPTKGIRRFKEEKRDRWLDGDELRRFFTALHAEPKADLRDYYLLLILTGARKTSLQRMRWGELSLDRGLWRISETKGGDPLTVPLVEPAVIVLRDRQRRANGDTWVFPGGTAEGHIALSSRDWGKLIARAGLEDVRLHDLRRSLGSHMAVGGASIQVIGKTLGHKTLAVTEVYARLSISPVRDAMESATGEMLRSAPAGLLPAPSNDG